MFRNQYLVVSTDIATSRFADAKCVDFNGLRIHAHPVLNVSIARCPDVEVAVLGYMIDPFSPDRTDQDILDALARESRTAEEMFANARRLSGRFVLLYKNSRTFLVTGDACHFRQIYFAQMGDGLVLTSSPKLFLSYFRLDLQTSSQKMEFTSLPAYRDQENAWYGDQTVDDRLQKLLPNHYLEIPQGRMKRMPAEAVRESVSDEDVIDNTAAILKGTYAALIQRYQLMQPITAGWDSRVLLSASRQFKDKIRFYVFSSSSTKSADIWVPRRLSERLGLDFTVIEPAPLHERFLSDYRAEHVTPRILPKTAQIQYHYDQHYDRNVINVNGNAAEIARCFYGYTARRVTVDMLLTFSGYGGRSRFVRDQLEKWYPQARQYAAESGIPLLDLFYWEQRMGNWGAMFPSEQDIAVEEISPFNNHALLLGLLCVSPKRRRAPSFSFFRKLVEHLWAETLTEKVNPDSRYVAEAIKGNAMIRYVVQASVSKLKSLRSR
ncbi:MAG TPA: hypothetical protein VIN62_04345 [Candidatus Cryosericum sp.]